MQVGSVMVFETDEEKQAATEITWNARRLTVNLLNRVVQLESDKLYLSNRISDLSARIASLEAKKANHA
jgi:BMFP domain-containing protein YqiC